MFWTNHIQSSTVVDVVVIAGFGLWFTLTVINSTKRGHTSIVRSLGPLNVAVPKWNFFSPHPGKYDYRVLYRDRRVDGSVTAWREADIYDGSVGVTRVIWNPELYRTKLLFDIVVNIETRIKRVTQGQSVSSGNSERGEDGLQPVQSGTHELSVYYLSLVNFVTHQPHSATAAETQFMLMRTSRRGDEHVPQFVSNFHQL